MHHDQFDIGVSLTRDSVVRLLCIPEAERSIRNELALLPALGWTALAEAVQLSQLLHEGQPADTFPMHWTVLVWIDGEDASAASDQLQDTESELAVDLAVGYLSPTRCSST